MWAEFIHEFNWTGTIERLEGFDASTQQLNVIARVNNPETVSDWPLRVGQYVNAQISGKTLNDVFVIPRRWVLWWMKRRCVPSSMALNRLHRRVKVMVLEAVVKEDLVVKVRVSLPAKAQAGNLIHHG